MADGPTVKFNNGTVVDIIDPQDILPVYADMVTECRLVNGIVHLSLAAMVVDGAHTTEAKARTCSRIRIPIGCVELIQATLTQSETQIHDTPESVN